MDPEDKGKEKKITLIRPMFILSKTDNFTGYFLVMLVKQKKSEKKGCATQNRKKSW